MNNQFYFIYPDYNNDRLISEVLDYNYEVILFDSIEEAIEFQKAPDYRIIGLDRINKELFDNGKLNMNRCYICLWQG